MREACWPVLLTQSNSRWSDETQFGKASLTVDSSRPVEGTLHARASVPNSTGEFAPRRSPWELRLDFAPDSAVPDDIRVDVSPGPS